MSNKDENIIKKERPTNKPEKSVAFSTEDLLSAFKSLI
jgi:hypothetical protein